MNSTVLKTTLPGKTPQCYATYIT